MNVTASRPRSTASRRSRAASAGTPVLYASIASTRAPASESASGSSRRASRARGKSTRAPRSGALRAISRARSSGRPSVDTHRTAMPRPRAAPSVPGPTQPTARTPRSTVERPRPRSRSATQRTAFADVKTSQSYRSSFSSARSSGAGSSGGRNSRRGTCTGFAPRARSICTRSLPCSRSRVTRTERPRRGRRSNQSRCSRNRTTSPTTMTVGERSPALSTAAGSSSRGATTTR